MDKFVWETPITDRTEADVNDAIANRGSNEDLKGAFNASDINRIEKNSNRIKQELNECGYYPVINEQKFDWEQDNLDFDNDYVDGVKDNLNQIRVQFGEVPDTTLLEHSDNLKYDVVNNMEKILDMANYLIPTMKKAYIYCGTINCGQPFGVRPMMILPEPTYSVTYSANGGTGSITDSNSPYEEGATVTIMSGFEREDYNFIGYNTQADGSGTSYSAGSSFVMGNADVTLYAQWEEVPQYEELYGIYSTDGAYIVLDYYPQGGVTEVYTEITNLTTRTAWTQIISADSGNSADASSCSLFIDDSNYFNCGWDGVNSQDVYATVNERFVINHTTTGTDINGTFIARVVGVGERLTVPLHMFARIRQDTGAVIINSSNVVNHGTIIGENGVEFYNLIPVRRLTDNLITMYDTISGEYQEVLGGTFEEYENPYIGLIEASVDGIVEITTESQTVELEKITVTELESGTYGDLKVMKLTLTEGFDFIGFNKNGAISTGIDITDFTEGLRSGTSAWSIVDGKAYFWLSTTSATLGYIEFENLCIENITDYVGENVEILFELFETYSGSVSNPQNKIAEASVIVATVV